MVFRDFVKPDQSKICWRNFMEYEASRAWYAGYTIECFYNREELAHTMWKEYNVDQKGLAAWEMTSLPIVLFVPVALLPVLTDPTHVLRISQQYHHIPCFIAPVGSRCRERRLKSFFQSYKWTDVPSYFFPPYSSLHFISLFAHEAKPLYPLNIWIIFTSLYFIVFRRRWSATNLNDSDKCNGAEKSPIAIQYWLQFSLQTRNKSEIKLYWRNEDGRVRELA